ncbi:MAG: hypothetical protein AAFX94_02250 [Myxococcota bacterium]
MRVGFLLAVLFGLTLAVPASAESAARKKKGRVTCGDDGRIRKINQIKKRAKALSRVARRTGVHVLDLGPDGASTVTSLNGARNDKDWCAVVTYSDALETMLEDQNASDAEFVQSKLERVDTWVRGSIENDRKRSKAERLVGRAKSDIRQGKLKVGNTKLNQALAILTGSRDMLQMPSGPLVEGAPRPEAPVAEEPETPSRPTSGVLSKSLALESCPELNQGEPGNGDLASILERLRDAMAEKKFRAVDFKYGPELFAILTEEGRDGSRGRAATAACVLLTRIAENPKIGMGIVMGRFSRVNALRDTQGVPASSESRFTMLVRQASEEIQQRQLEQAYATLDELLILLGDPVDQSQDVP